MIAGVEVKTAHCSNYARALNRTAFMPGLGPGTHAFASRRRGLVVDGRVKPGQDGEGDSWR